MQSVRESKFFRHRSRQHHNLPSSSLSWQLRFHSNPMGKSAATDEWMSIVSDLNERGKVTVSGIELFLLLRPRRRLPPECDKLSFRFSYNIFVIRN